MDFVPLPPQAQPSLGTSRSLGLAPISPSVPVRAGSARVDFVPLPPQAQPSLRNSRSLGLALVVLVGSLGNPYFVIRRRAAVGFFNAAAAQSFGVQADLELSLPSFSAPVGATADFLLQSSKECAVSLGMRDPIVTLAGDFGNNQVYLAPSLAMSASTFSSAASAAFHSEFELVSWSVIAGSAIEIKCATAFELAVAFAGYVIPAGQPWSLPSSSEIDWGPPVIPVDLSDAAGWEHIKALTRQTETALVATFAAVPSSDSHCGYLISCASRVLSDARPSFSDVPAYMRRLGDPHVHHHAELLPFSSRFDPTLTLRLPVQSQQHSAYQPMSYADILAPEALRLIRVWLLVEHSNMAAIAAFGPLVRRVPDAIATLGFGKAIETHGVLVIGQDQFLELARGVIWDCRGFALGLPAVPMDFGARPQSDLNIDFIRSSLGAWPDQELVGFLLDGVQFRADLPLQFLFMPHLGSISMAWDSVQSEIWRLTNFDYNDLHHVLPFAPCRFVPQGSTPRKLEPTRFRRTSDGGAPRQDVYDSHGIKAVSLNSGIGLHSSALNDGPVSPGGDEDAAPKWAAPETKPQLIDKAFDDYVLRLAAFVFHEPLNGWTDDFADYFNQIPLAPSEYWTACFAWSFSALGPRDPLVGFGVPITVVAEKRLGFGVSLSSNVAQRFSEAIVAVFRQRFDAEEFKLFARTLDPSTGDCVPYNLRDSLTRDPSTGWTGVCRWIDNRRRLSVATGRNELRRYSVHILNRRPRRPSARPARLERRHV